MFCANCGTTLTSDNHYCPQCGKKLEIHTTRRSIVSSILKVGAVLLVLGGLYLGSAFWMSEDIVETPQNQLMAIRNNHLTEAYYGYTSHEFQKALTLEGFRDFVHTYPPLLRSEKVTFNEIGIKGNLAKLTGFITTHENQKIQIEYQLVKEDGKWKVLNFKIAKPVQQKTEVSRS